MIMINLGDIAVKNSFECGSVERKKSSYGVWVAENMTVALTNLRVSRFGFFLSFIIICDLVK